MSDNSSSNIESDLTQSDRLHQWLRRRMLLGFVLTSLLIGAVATFWLYRAEVRTLEHELGFDVHLQAMALGSELSRMKNITAQVTSRTSIRQALERYNEGRIDLPSLKEFTEPKLADALDMAKDMLGIRRLGIDGKLLVQVGDPIPTKLWPNDIQKNAILLGAPHEHNGVPALVLSAPIHNDRGAIVGIDLVMFDFRRINEIVQRFFQRYPVDPHSGIAMPSPSGVKVIYPNVAAGAPENDLLLKETATQILEGGKDAAYVRNDADGDAVVAAHRIADSDWFFLFSSSSDRVFAPARSNAIYTAVLILILTLIGSALTLIITRPLSGRISVRAHTMRAMLEERGDLLRKSRESEERLKEAQHLAHIGNWELDLVTDTLHWSEEVYRIFEMDPRRFGASYEAFLEVVHPADRERVDRAYTESVKNHKPYDIVHRLQFEDSRIKYVHEHCKTYYDVAGKPLRSIGTVQDVTAQYETQMALVESEKRFHAIFDNALDGIVLVNVSSGAIVDANATFCRMVGYAHDELLRLQITDLHPEADGMDDSAQGGKRWWEGNRLLEDIPLLKKEGGIIYADIASSPIELEGRRCTVGLLRDVTDRRIAKEALRRSEANLAEAQEIAWLGSWELDCTTGKAFWSDQEYRCLGYDPHVCEASYENFEAAVHPDDRARVNQAVQAALQGELDPYDIEHRVIWQDGSEHIVHERAVVERDEQGSPLRMIGTTQDITGYRRAQEQLAQTNAAWTHALDQFDDVVYLLDMQYRLVRANTAFYRMTGVDPEHAVGRPVAELIHPLGQPSDCPLCRAQEEGRDTVFTLEPDAPNNLTGRPVEVTLKMVRDDHGADLAMLVSLHDLSHSRQIEARLRLAASVFENTDEGVVITDASARVVEVNRAFTEILGYTREEVIGQKPSLWKSERQDETFYRDMWKALSTTGRWRGELWNRRKNGEVFPQWQTISSVLDENGLLTHYVGVFSDISQIKHSQQQLDYLAHHDALTNLPNRLLLNERLDQAIRHAERHSRQLAVIFMDLDQFKHINDSLGHPAGDELLQEVAEKIQGAMRQGDTVARIGGDEFVVILEDVVYPEAAGVAARKIMRAIARPFRLQEQEVRITGSLGISLYPRDGADPATLLRNADAAMYRAKEEGRNSYHFYTEELTRNAFERISLENNLRQALEEGQLHLVYQPQINLHTGEMIGAEALLRWHHPTQGFISPARFIPVAEESGLIHPIGQWVLQTACRQTQEWLDKGLDPGTIAVNIAGPQIQRGRLVTEVEQSLSVSGLAPSRLELEVTEGFIMQQPEAAIGQLETLRRLGVTLAIDDFGTGYSSLSYLKKLPIHKLKIDRSFVRDIPRDTNDMAIADAVIALGKSLQLTVIAEGVETEEQSAFLKKAGCQEAQGYLYSRPVSAEEFEAMLGEEIGSKMASN